MDETNSESDKLFTKVEDENPVYSINVKRRGGALAPQEHTTLKRPGDSM